MLHVEYVQSARSVPQQSGGQIRAILLAETRPILLAETRPVLKDNRRETRIWVFALTAGGADSSGSPSNGPPTAGNPTMDRIAETFRSAPMNEPLGVTVDRVMYEEAQHPGISSSGKGLVLCALCFDRAVVAHTGNACCYLIRHNHATRLTLGNVRLIDYQIQPGDVLLLSADSLQAVKGSEMAEIAGHRVDLTLAAEKLAELARQRGESASHFDIVMIRVLAVERSNRAQNERGKNFTVRARA